MKIKITAKGIWGKDGKPVPVGTVLDVKEEPKNLAGRYEVVGERVAITNPENDDKPRRGRPPKQREDGDE